MPTDRRRALTPDALEMVDTIARTGSFAAAARELGKVPSALTYSVRQLEEALDALLFDRRSRQAQLTTAGEELLREGRRLLQEMDAVANRVQRVAAGWEATLSIAVDALVAPAVIYDLIERFYALRVELPGVSDTPTVQPPPTRLRLRNEVLAGTWEALVSGQVDLALGVTPTQAQHEAIDTAELGAVQWVFAVAPHHPLATAAEPLSLATLSQHRVVAIADSAQRLGTITFGVLPGQDVLTVPSMTAKLEAQMRALGCGRLPEPVARPHVQAGRLVVKQTELDQPTLPSLYAWRRQAAQGKALAWWLQQLDNPVTRRALLDKHGGCSL